MSILSMNISAAVMITMTILLRRIFKYHIPHSVFCVLWAVIIIRLFIPVSINSELSLWNFFVEIEEASATSTGIINSKAHVYVSDAIQNSYAPIGNGYIILWGTVCVILGAYFLLQYIKLSKAAKQAVIPENKILNNRIEKLGFYRNISIGIMKGLKSPAVFGVIHPIIFFPEQFDFNNESTNYILLHECGHIKYFHTLYKIFLTVLICVYWYNPFVWIMYFALDSDMEITADRYVISKIGNESKAIYAATLITAAESKIKPVIFYYHYKSKLTKERIEAIMRFKKLTAGAVIITVLIPAFMFTVFATTDTIITGKKLDEINIAVVDAEYEKEAVQMKDITIELPWKELHENDFEGLQILSSEYEIKDYEYVAYSREPPKKITILTAIEEKTYKGTLELTRHIYSASDDKYTGYYSGNVYSQ